MEPEMRTPHFILEQLVKLSMKFRFGLCLNTHHKPCPQDVLTGCTKHLREYLTDFLRNEYILKILAQSQRPSSDNIHHSSLTAFSNGILLIYYSELDAPKIR